MGLLAELRARERDPSILSHPLFLALEPHVVKKILEIPPRKPARLSALRALARELLRAGRKRYGTQTILERIRWYTTIETFGDEFKINNNYAACYTRMLMILYPVEFGNFFRVKKGKL
jgi:hypothetical protein